MDLIQRPGIIAGLQRILNIRGRPQMGLESSVRFGLGFDVTEAPFFRELGIRVGNRDGVTAVAGEYNHTWLQNINSDWIVQVDRIIIVNPSSANTYGFFIGWMSAGNGTTIGALNDSGFVDLSGGVGNIRRPDIRLRSGSDVNSFVIPFDYRVVRPESEIVVDMPKGGVVMDPSQTSDLLAIGATAVNTPLYSTWYGRLWPVNR